MTDGRYNPYNLLNNTGYSRNWAVTAQSKVGLKQKLDFLTKGLSWRVAMSFDASMASRVNRSKTPATYFADGRDIDGNLILRQISAGTALGNPTAGSTSGSKSIYTETALDYAHIFAEKHNVTALLLYNQKERQIQVGDNGLQRLPYRNQSVVARATYGFDTRYLIEASFGATGSENFADDHRWGIFPAVGAAWWVSHESFMQNIQKYINKLKIRGSFGVTGNDDIGDSNRFPYRGTVTAPSSGEGYPFGFQTGANTGQANVWNGIVEDNFARPLLTWEIDRKTNFGLDLGLFKGAVDLSVDYFYNFRYSILTERTSIQTTSGFQKMPWQNYGKVENNGLDANIVVKQSFGKLNLSARGNFTFARNNIVERDEVVPKDWYQLYTGNAIGTPKLFIAEGLYTPDDFIISEDANGRKTYVLRDELPATGSGVRNLVAPGDIKYKDLNGDNVIDDYDATYSRDHHQFYSTAMPEIVYGFGLNAEYKGFNVGVFFQGVTNVSANLMASRGNFMPFIGGVEYQAARVQALDRWTFNDPYNQDVLFPRMHPSSFSWNEKASTWWYRDASFLRLKNVELGYTVDEKLIKKAHLTSLRVYVQGLNLYTWDQVKYWDAEQRSANSGSKYPLSSSWTIGLDIRF
jgi:TonB-linked SusC/RagA family outer membrane protein